MPKRLIEATISYNSQAGVTTFDAVSCRDKATFTFEDDNPPARRPEKALETLSRQLSKSAGQYVFTLGNVNCDITRFYPASVLNGIRRQLAEALEKAALERMDQSRKISPENVVNRAVTKISEEHLTYLANGNYKLRLEFDCKNCEMIVNL